MKRAALGALIAVALSVAGVSYAKAQPAETSPATIQDCILAAAHLYREPPAILLILLNVEGGTLGAVSQNTNDTVDIGPMQVNQIWVPSVAAHWHASKDATFTALRDNFCANVEAGAWILRQGLDEAHGDLWGGVAYYHSHNPDYQRAYLMAVLNQALRLEGLAAHQGPPRQASLVETVNPAQPRG